MKIRFLPVWLVVVAALAISPLAAQDVTVTDPAWLDPEAPSADVPPTFKKRPKVEIPEEIRATGAVAYALVCEMLDEKGKRLNMQRSFTNPYLENVISKALAVDAGKYVPAKREGKDVVATCWFSIIFNPRSADADKKDAAPRVLAVAPVVVKKSDLPAGTKLPLVIWATLSIDEKGRLQNYTFENAALEPLRPQVGGSLHVWKFAPARREGMPMAAELKVPLILNQQFAPKMPGTQPKVLYRVLPIYPFAMKSSGFRGEVLLEFIVDKTGQVKDPVVVKTNNPHFNEAAIEALMQWKFQPGSVGGVPANCRMQQPFVFDLSDAGSEQGRDYATVRPANKKAQEKLPKELQYDIPPKAKALFEPVFPYPLLDEKRNGKAKVVFLIDQSGKVVEVKVMEATKPELGLALTASIETYEFVPAMKDGKPVASVLNTEKEFSDALVGEENSRLLKLEKKHPEKIVESGKLDTPVKPIYQRGPMFPTALRATSDHGSAIIEVLVNEDGKVCLPRIVEATDPAFGYAAMQAVTEWRFTPPMAGGKPAITRAKIPFVFNLEAPKATPEIPVPELKQP